ncbi:hypothetical protein D2V17_14285 [Aurantiacibacter xanthus]|uniref:ArsR family transcriptional regulator n=1 Tax=Aurantiacibacter xanthus TaxID=1784712 RepID=A0A3A1P1C7_9SPHN|nr:hypothetical protein [Aurantiacibacter xanthus]RIV82967.1 hypothetical protein D2V17_14285 [Aurantiacibacter xanthus]
MSLSQSLSGVHEQLAADARLFILVELDAQTDGHLNAVSLRSLLRARYGIDRTPEWLATQLNLLADLGAVEVISAGAIPIARILAPGQHHVAQRSILAGVTRPRDAS